MKLFRALLLAAVAGLCVADAKKVKLCEADHTPAPTPAKTGGADKPAAPTNSPSVQPVVTPAPPAAKPAAPVTPAPATDDDDGPATVAPNDPAPAPANGGGVATNAGSVKASFTYRGEDAGGPGIYQMVTDVGTCAKTPHSMYSPVSPLDDDLTFVFRGPMTIHNIAIFDGASGAWTKVSSYEKGGAASNLVFLNNRNIDYSGKSAPQSFATADGRGTAQSAVSFAGELGSATAPGKFTVYADEKTGAEVNIFQDKKCGEGAECKGYYDKDGTAHLGWAGGKKIFITKVQMPRGGAPDMPAVWALNGQVVRSNQYGCNCRGMGTRGGCGEFNIAEVIEKDLSVVATHYYKYDASTGHDSWGKRPMDAPATYITLIDESFGVKVLEVGANDFDFGANSISAEVVNAWKSA